MPLARTRSCRPGMRKLFSADPARMGRFDGPPKCDSVSESLVDGTPSDLKGDLITLLGKEKVLPRAIDLVRCTPPIHESVSARPPGRRDASNTTDDIVGLFRYCRENGRHATFRAAGNQPERTIPIGRYIDRCAPSLSRRETQRTMAAACARTPEWCWDTSTQFSSDTAGGSDRIRRVRTHAPSVA